MATITDTTLVDSRNRTFDLSTVYVRSDGTFVVVFKSTKFGDLPYQVVNSGNDAEIWEAITEWKEENSDHFEDSTDDSTTEETTDETEEDEDVLLEEARELKLEKLTAKFTTASEGAYVDSSLSFRADANDEASRNVSGLVTLLEDEDEDTTVQFCDYDNDMHELTLTQLKTLQKEIIKNGSSLYQQKWEYRDAIEDATSTDELKAIKIKFTYLSFSEE